MFAVAGFPPEFCFGHNYVSYTVAQFLLLYGDPSFVCSYNYYLTYTICTIVYYSIFGSSYLPWLERRKLPKLSGVVAL